MVEATRRDVQKFRPKIEEAIRRESFEDFKNILTVELKIPLGSDHFRSCEANFWRAVAERRNMKRQR